MLKVPEYLRAELNSVKLFLAIRIDRMLIETRGKDYVIDSFELLESPENHRFVKLLINGETVRFNYYSKKEFINLNGYWLYKQPYNPNYKNAIANKY